MIPRSGSEGEQLAPGHVQASTQETLYEQAIQERIVAKEVGPSEPTRGLFVLYDELKARFGDGCVSLGEGQLVRHGIDRSMAVPRPTGLVFYPEDASQISWLLQHLPGGMSVIPYGKGTSTEGQTVPTQPETISLDMHKMRRILKYNRQDMLVTVEAGLDLHALNGVLAEDGLWFPVDPMANATVGGMAAEDAEGVSVHRYGRMSPNVTALGVVLADGHMIGMTEHSPLMHMFIGSEGSLGVITELTLRLAPVKKQTKTVSLCYSRVEDAALGIPEIRRTQEGLIACFLLDCGAMRVLGEAHQRLPGCPTILLQLDYDRPLCMEHLSGTIDVQEWSDEALQRMLWSSLGNVWLAGIPTTVTVPPSKIAELVREYHPDGMDPTSNCLVANGSTGTVTFIRPEDQVPRLREEVFQTVKRLAGSVGGYGARDWTDDVGLWAKIKQALDPRKILGHMSGGIIG